MTYIYIYQIEFVDLNVHFLNFFKYAFQIMFVTRTTELCF